MNINQLLELTVQRNASDLHLLVGFPPTLRIYGDLIPIPGTSPLSSQEVESLILPIVNPIQKQLFLQQFELDFSYALPQRARFRVNFYRQLGQVSASFRMIPLTIPRLEDLGLPPAANKFITLRQGFVLVTGPTGHGKSTTLAALINQINLTRPVHIITIEDPVEYVYPKGKAMMSQREMYVDTQSWEKALRAALREDPDVVLVGEMRDYQTIAAALTVAETGHLVLATLHTNSAAQSVDRVVDVFPDNQQPQIRIQLAATLEAIISQRLVPTIAPGRALAVELLLRTPALSSMVREGRTHLIDNLIQTSAELGMVSLEASLASLVRAGKVLSETALNFALRPDFLAKLI